MFYIVIEVIITFVETVVLRGYCVIKMYNFEDIISMVLAKDCHVFDRM